MHALEPGGPLHTMERPFGANQRNLSTHGGLLLERSNGR